MKRLGLKERKDRQDYIDTIAERLIEVVTPEAREALLQLHKDALATYYPHIETRDDVDFYRTHMDLRKLYGG